MSWNWGGGETKQKGTQTLVLPAATPAEEELRALNAEVMKEQLASLREAKATQAAEAASPLAAQQRLLEEKATANLLARATGTAPVLSPEEQARLDEIYGAARTTGEEDLMRFGEEIAGQRGMTVADSPIGNELLRQRRLFGENLGAQKSAAALDLGNAAASFNASLTSFQNQLKQQAFANRLAIAGMTPASYEMQSQLFGERLATAPRSSTGSGVQSQWGAGLSGQDVYGWGKGSEALGFYYR